jgi:hypothetical protein
MSSGCEVKRYSFIPSGEAAEAGKPKPNIAQETIAALVKNFWRSVTLLLPFFAVAADASRFRLSIDVKGTDTQMTFRKFTTVLRR